MLFEPRWINSFAANGQIGFVYKLFDPHPRIIPEKFLNYRVQNDRVVHGLRRRLFRRLRWRFSLYGLAHLAGSFYGVTTANGANRHASRHGVGHGCALLPTERTTNIIQELNFQRFAVAIRDRLLLGAPAGVGAVVRAEAIRHQPRFLGLLLFFLLLFLFLRFFLLRFAIIHAITRIHQPTVLLEAR